MVIGHNRMLPHTTRNKAFNSVHAEMDAFSKIHLLKRRKNGKNNNKKPFKVNMLVIQMNRSSELKMSKPCYHCIKKLAKHSNVIINNVYYSNREGGLTMEKFSDLVNSEETYLTKAHV